MDLPRLARQNEGFERFDMAEIRHKETVVGRFERLDTLVDSVRTVSSSRSIPGRFVSARRAARERSPLLGRPPLKPASTQATHQEVSSVSRLDAVAGAIERDDPGWGMLDHSPASTHRRKRCASARASANKRFQSSGGCPLSSILRNTW